MAFTSEVTAKLNLDKTGFEKAWTSTVATVAKAGTEINNRLQKAFSFKDVFKGLMQGIGIGTVDQITRTVTGYFEDQANAAKDAEARSRNAVDRQRQYALSVASVSGRYKILGKQVKDLDIDIEMQKKLIDDLSSNPLTFINESSRKQLSDAKKGLEDLQDKQTMVLEQIDQEKKARRKVFQEMFEEAANEDKLAEIKRKGASDLEIAQTRLNQLEEERNKLVAEGNKGSEKYLANYKEIQNVTRRIKDIQAEAAKALPAEYISVGRQAATGRGRKPRPRGRTETERLADQAAEAEMRSQEAILKGDKVGAARYAEMAAKGYAKAGRRIADASSLIKKDTAESLKGELVTANKTLTDIKANLDPKEIE